MTKSSSSPAPAHSATGMRSVPIGNYGFLSDGEVSALLGVAGFLLGSGPDRMFEALASLGLHLGTMDHLVHILLGVVFLIGGFLTKADVGAD